MTALKQVGALPFGSAASTRRAIRLTPWFGSENGVTMQGDKESRISIKSGMAYGVVAIGCERVHFWCVACTL